jgi:iron complex transport system ATP-binding protein
MRADQIVLPRIKTQLPALNLALKPGSMTAVVGPNGCGKSTLLSVLCGLLQPNEGRVEIAGRDLGRMPISERAQHIAWVASTPPRGSALKVRAVLELAARFGPTAGASSVEEILTQFGLQEHADMSLSNLSDGWAQRAMIARATAQNTQIIILDEPTAFLDLPATLAVFGALKSALERGRTVVMSSHDFSALERSEMVTDTLQFYPDRIGHRAGFDAERISEVLLG